MWSEKVGVSSQLIWKCSWLAFAFLSVSALPARPQTAAPKVKVGSFGAAVPVDQTDDTNARITELAIAETAKPGDYVIGFGDLLGIEVLDVAELTRDVRVNESGFVSLPLIRGKIEAAGLTTTQFQDKIAELLETNELVRQAEVTVTVKERHGEPITLTGAVGHPIVIQAVGRVTLLEALSQAGGIATDAGETINITRPAQASDPDNPSPETVHATSISVDLNQLLDSGDPKYNIPLLGGDMVNVPRAGIVYAVGAVLRSGGYVMAQDHEQMSVLKLLALSGGLTPTAKAHHVIILRKNGNTGARDQVLVDIRKILTLKSGDVLMVRDDIMFVPDSVANKAVRRTGEIAIGLATGVAIYRIE
jgi:polysaccharide export outer membrane protein